MRCFLSCVISFGSQPKLVLKIHIYVGEESSNFAFFSGNQKFIKTKELNRERKRATDSERKYEYKKIEL